MATNTDKAALVLVTGMKPPANQDVIIARIPKAKRFEVRVSVGEFKGKRRVDVRQWFVPNGTTEWWPTKRGVVVDEPTLAAIVDALQEAQRHFGGGALPNAEQPAGTT